VALLHKLFQKKNDGKSITKSHLVLVNLLGILALLTSTYSFAYGFYQANSGRAYYPNPSTLEESCNQWINARIDNKYNDDHTYHHIGPQDNFPYACFYTTVNRTLGSVPFLRSVPFIRYGSSICANPANDDGLGNCKKEDSKQGTTCSAPASKGPNPLFENPIVVATGNKFQTETDYQSQSPFGLSFVRYFSSTASAIDKGVGKKWSYGYQNAIQTSETNVYVNRSNGQTFVYTIDGTNWVSDADVSETLIENISSEGNRTGWAYTTSNDATEIYNSSGQLLSVTSRAGQSKTFTYDIATTSGGDGNDATLDKVIGFTGETMLFRYAISNEPYPSKRILGMTDPEGNTYSYSYDAIGNIINVVLPDDTPLDETDNPTRTYHYENGNFPHHLTGISDETNVRYVTWEYDAQGRATSSEHADGVDRGALVYHEDGSVTTTNPLGKDTTYHFETLHGVKKVTQVEGHATASCAGANQNYTYDANGYIESKTDWQGNVTTYSHDARGLEASRTEASGTPEERIITTDWHTDFRLPTKITAPGQVTNFVYDTQGRLTSQTTSDVQPK
jgi:YD repeat-containing protein